MRRANYKILDVNPEKGCVTIQDVGPWDLFPTVTNSAEGVVEQLVSVGFLPPGRRLFCIDSEGTLDELKIKDGKFDGFTPGPRE
jgi:hypothetical protein